MLVVSRRKGEDIVISHPDGDITIKLLGVKKGREIESARIGIEAVRSIHVLRGELTTKGVTADCDNNNPGKATT